MEAYGFNVIFKASTSLPCAPFAPGVFVARLTPTQLKFPRTQET